MNATFPLLNPKTDVRIKNISCLPCTAHSLQLMIEKGLVSVEIFSSRFKEANSFSSVSKQAERLEQVQRKISIQILPYYAWVFGSSLFY